MEPLSTLIANPIIGEFSHPAKYKVNDYPYQYDNETTNGQDGYAGVFGVDVTKFQITIE